MALQTSGAISLANLATEFGGATPHSLSEYYAGGGLVPAGTSGTNGAVPSSGSISLLNFYGTTNVSYFINNTDYWAPPEVVASEDILQITTDPSGNIYTKTRYNYNNVYFLSKYNSGGTIQWVRTVNTDLPNYVTGLLTGELSASSDNLYFGGYSVNIGAFVAKKDFSGTLQWSRHLLTVNTEGFITSYTLGAVATNSNVYFAGQDQTVNASFSTYSWVAKYNSAGVIQWQRKNTPFAQNGAGMSYYHIAIDSSENIYTVGTTYGAGGYTWGILTKREPTIGLISWYRYIFPMGQNNGVVRPNLAVSPNGDCYVVFITEYNPIELRIMKVSTDGTVLWNRSFSIATAIYGGTPSDAPSVSIDSSENVYVTVSLGSNYQPSNGLLLAKYNSSGVIQWQRRFKQTAGQQTELPAGQPAQNTEGMSVKVNSTGAILVGTGNNLSALLISLPADGSKTGTYTNGSSTYVYEASSITEAAASPVLVASSAYNFFEVAGSLTDSATTISSAAHTPVSSTVFSL